MLLYRRIAQQHITAISTVILALTYNVETRTPLQREANEKSKQWIKKFLRSAEGRTKSGNNTFLRRNLNSNLLKGIRRETITTICP
jgi:Na+-translocating ferredoxin:NAD+ oxidoreductase RnfG subunit